MKGILSVLLLLSLLLCSCNTAGAPTHQNSEKMIGVWITYGEIKKFAGSEKGFYEEFSQAVSRCREIGVNNVFVHVRAFCDAVYESRYFPKCDYLGSLDALSVMTDLCHKNGIKIHAWINPYRVSNQSDLKKLPETSPARKFLEDQNTENDKNVCVTKAGIYLNPAENEVRRLILCGVREILENYDVDGIHFDDYFYPTTDEKFDEASYKEYEASAEYPLDIGNWRRQNVNTLLNACYCAVKQKGENLVFGISPAADIDKCYNSMYADVEGWLGGGYIDYIMPQLYFGFRYPKENFRFDSLLEKWLDITGNRSADLYCGLPNYKIGSSAQADKEEWNSDKDIIARQIALLYEKGVEGFTFFSYESLFSDNELNRIQLNKIKEELKKKGS
ncbi:MAG: family 10 glycosylhydrolase [Clostridiales bacterium]|nr:family 10 glycosylhydrolase [Candidatus Equinaster intestinalis]